MGFPVPVGAWFAGPYQGLARELLLSARSAARGIFNMDAVAGMIDEHTNGVRNNDQRIWMLANLELWQRIFLDGESPDDIRMS